MKPNNSLDNIMNKQERSPLSPSTVKAAQEALVISQEDAASVLNAYDPVLLNLIQRAVRDSASDKQLRSALNRVLYVSRNATFAQACKEQLQKEADEA